MDGLQVLCTVFVTVVSFCAADHEHMVSDAGSITVAVNFETKLECVMNIQPDNFQWKFYPLEQKEAYNPKARISLTTSPFQFVPPGKYNSPQKRMSVLTLQADSGDIAGDYQCLAYYGAVVVASVPWRVTLSTLSTFPYQQNTTVAVVQGNTVDWRCDPPMGNPEPYVDYFKDGQWFQSQTLIRIKSLILPNVTSHHTGSYTCKAGNVEGKVTAPVFLNLQVFTNTRPEKPRFIQRPKTLYQVSKGDSVFLECAAVGNPPPKGQWTKNGGVIAVKRSELTEGGLVIRNVDQGDAGVYTCTQMNRHGAVTETITIEYAEPPNITCLLDTTDVTQGETLDLDCEVKGAPAPEITWFLNGFVVTNDSKITTNANRISFKPAEKRHAGKLQIFARNPLKTVYESIFIKVIPLSTTQESSTDLAVVPTRVNHKRPNSRKGGKHAKMVPPLKPNVSRISDEAVLVRWNVQPKGLPIQFFKVQYKELASPHDHSKKSSKWMTTNADIEPHIRSYEVGNLKPDNYYRFRIAAVYSNNDNKNSPNSDKFFLKKEDFDKRNTLPVPIITNAEPVNSTSVKIYWKCDPAPNMTMTVEGFFVNYNSASSATDYMKETVDGANTSSYVLSHLQPDTVYDIKLQSFTSKSASQLSHLQKAKTLGVASSTTVPELGVSPVSPPNIEGAGISKLYVYIAAGVLGGCGFIFGVVGVLMICRKWKQKKNSNRGVDDHLPSHHIQADGNEYVVGPKNPPRSNGCVPSNRMTITANPLADADNKVDHAPESPP